MNRAAFLMLFLMAVPFRMVLSQEWQFMQVCDPQLGMVDLNNELQRLNNVVDNVNNSDIDFVVVCGDFVQHASDSTFAQFTSIIEKFTVPCYLAPGNHDMSRVPQKNNIKLYKKYFGRHFFTFNHNGYRFIITNSMLWKHDLGWRSRKHNRWFLKNCKQAERKNEPVVVAGHYPLYIDSLTEEEHKFNFSIPKRNALLETFEQYGVEAYLSGHQHELKVHQQGRTQLVTGETLSKNFDDRPFGVRLWTVQKDTMFHKFISIEP